MAFDRSSIRGPMFVYDEHGRRDLGLEKRNPAWVGSAAKAVNAHGWVTGSVTTADGLSEAYVCDGEHVTILGVGAGVGVGVGNELNNAGHVVGNDANGPFLFDGHRTYELVNLADTGAAWTLLSAEAINDAEMVVGYAASDLDPNLIRAFLAVPVPEPVLCTGDEDQPDRAAPDHAQGPRGCKPPGWHHRDCHPGRGRQGSDDGRQG